MRKGLETLAALVVTLALFAILFHHHRKSIHETPRHRARTPVALSKTAFSKPNARFTSSPSTDAPLIISPPSGQEVVDEIVRRARVESIHLKGWLITFNRLTDGSGLAGDPITWQGDASRDGRIRYHYFVSATLSAPRPGYNLHSSPPMLVSLF